MDQREVQEERSSSFTKTTKSVRVVQSSESVESSVGDFSTGTGSPSSMRKETRTVSQLQKTFNSSGELQLEPLLSLGSRFTGKDADFEDVSTQLCCFQEQEKFEMKLDVTEYSPEDIQVKVLDDMVVITGKQEIRINENNFRSRSFSKKFSIPPGVTPEKIKCSLSKDGMLTISAPLEKEEQRRQMTTQTQSTTSVTSNMSNVTDLSQGGRNSPVFTPRKVNSNSSPEGQELGTFTDSKKFTVRVEVKRFEAEEIKVKVSKSLITVEGKHESEFASRSFYKEFTLVSGVQTDKMECTMSTDGILTITAPIEEEPNQGPDAVSHESQVCQTQETRSTTVQQKQEVRQHQEKVTQQEVRQQEVTQQKQDVTQQKQEVVQHHVIQEETTQDKKVTERNQQVAPQGPKAPEPKAKSPPPKEQSPKPTTPAAPKSKSPPKMPEEGEDTKTVPISTLPSPEPRVTSPSTEEGPNEICQTNDGKILKVRVNVTEYRREELRVKIVKRMIVIEGTHEDELSSRSFLKKVPIPPGVEPNQVTSALAPNGVLLVTAPVTPCQDSKLPPTTDATEKSLKTQQERVEIRKQTEQTQETVDEDDFVMIPNREAESPPPMSADDDDDMPKEISHVLNEDKYEMVLDVSKYKREEIEVKVSKTTIRIEGKQTRQFSSRSFFKESPIPDGVRPEDVKSTLSPNGHLTITAPIEKKAQPAPTQVPKETAHKIVHDFSTVDVKETEKRETRLEKSNSDDQVNKVTEVNDGKTFKVTIDVKEYRREEITIRVTRSVIRIEGKHETEAQTNTKRAATKTFFKEVPLPAGVEPNSITSSVSPQGLLTITAPITTTTEHKTVKKDLSSQTQQKITETQQHHQRNVQENVSETQRTQQNIQHQKETTQTQHQQNARQETRESVDRNSTQKTSTTEVTYLKSTLDLNAAKETIDGAVRDIDPSEKTFEMVYDVSGYKAEDLTIRITKYVVTVEGKQCTEFSSRSFFKKFSIPHGVDPRDFKPTLTAQGILTFSAPIDHSLPISGA